MTWSCFLICPFLLSNRTKWKVGVDLSSKKICIVTTTSETINCFLLEQGRFLGANGYDVTIVCNNDPELAKKLPSEITFHPVKMKRGMDGIGSVFSVIKLYRLFNKERFDIVQYSTPNASMYAAIASFLARIPIRLYCQWGIRYVGFQGLKRKINKFFEKTICTLSTYIEPDSNGNLLFSHQEGLYKENKSKVVWNGSANGVNLKKFNVLNKSIWKEEIRKKYHISSEDFVIGFVGRIGKDKGINELLSACKTISKKYPHVKLLIVGSKDHNDGLDMELMSWSLNAEMVTYCGYTKEVEKYLAALDVYILPSYREGFGSGVIEAESMGVPVIVSDIPGPTDAMKKGVTGLVVPKASVKHLVGALEAVISTPNMLVEMSEGGIKFAREHFDQEVLWQHILEDRNELYSAYISSTKEDSHVKYSS